jgi:hypothetical protein
MLAMLWQDREQRYIICTTSSPVESEPYQRMRCRQSPQGAPRVSLEVPQPKAAEMYCSACARMDRRSRRRQDELQLERKYITTIGSMRLNMNVIGMIRVDSWLLCLGARGAIAGFQSDFYEEFATKLVFNNYDSVGLCSPASVGIGCNVTWPQHGRSKYSRQQGTSFSPKILQCFQAT